MTFNLQDLKNMQAFMQRVDLKGTESMAHAELMMKIGNAMQQMSMPPPEVPIDEDLPDEAA
jgi:hypothetical protein